MRIAFLPTGQVDMTLTSPSDLAAANQLLAPTIQLVNQFATASNLQDFDFWVLISWIFVSHYWITLLDFGQLAPSTFTYNETTGAIESYAPIRYPSTNNIFVNQTLFEIYSAYLHNVIIPLFEYGDVFPSEFSQLSDTNQLTGRNLSLEILYSCTDLQLKTPGDLVISVLVADWAFISTFYALILLGGGWLEKNKIHGG